MRSPGAKPGLPLARALGHEHREHVRALDARAREHVRGAARVELGLRSTPPRGSGVSVATCGSSRRDRTSRPVASGTGLRTQVRDDQRVAVVLRERVDEIDHTARRLRPFTDGDAIEGAKAGAVRRRVGARYADDRGREAGHDADAARRARRCRARAPRSRRPGDDRDVERSCRRARPRSAPACSRLLGDVALHVDEALHLRRRRPRAMRSPGSELPVGGVSREHDADGRRRGARDRPKNTDEVEQRPGRARSSPGPASTMSDPLPERPAPRRCACRSSGRIGSVPCRSPRASSRSRRRGGCRCSTRSPCRGRARSSDRSRARR